MRPPAVTRALGAIATASAIVAVTLGCTGPAGASPMPARQSPADRVPVGFNALSASFISPGWGVVLGAVGSAGPPGWRANRSCG